MYMYMQFIEHWYICNCAWKHNDLHSPTQFRPHNGNKINFGGHNVAYCSYSSQPAEYSWVWGRKLLIDLFICCTGLFSERQSTPDHYKIPATLNWWSVNRRSMRDIFSAESIVVSYWCLRGLDQYQPTIELLVMEFSTELNCFIRSIYNWFDLGSSVMKTPFEQ